MSEIEMPKTAPHKVQCRLCPKFETIPVAIGDDPEDVAIHLLDDWSFDADNGWRCPECSTGSTGAKR